MNLPKIINHKLDLMQNGGVNTEIQANGTDDAYFRESNNNDLDVQSKEDVESAQFREKLQGVLAQRHDVPQQVSKAPAPSMKHKESVRVLDLPEGGLFDIRPTGTVKIKSTSSLLRWKKPKAVVALRPQQTNEENASEKIQFDNVGVTSTSNNVATVPPAAPERIVPSNNVQNDVVKQDRVISVASSRESENDKPVAVVDSTTSKPKPSPISFTAEASLSNSNSNGDMNIVKPPSPTKPPTPTKPKHITLSSTGTVSPPAPQKVSPPQKESSTISAIPAATAVSSPESTDSSTKSVKNPVIPLVVHEDKDGFTEEELVQERTTLKNWDPTTLLKELYEVKLLPDNEIHSSYINMEGYMEKLPTNKKKATLLKTWKRRYFKAKDGNLYYFESGGGEKASACFQLMGGSLEDLGNCMMGVDDGRGRYLVVRCPTEKEFLDWKNALESQMGGNIKATYIKPMLSGPPSTQRKAVIIDIGSCSVRAGILADKPSLPEVFFPNILATDPSGKKHFGFDAYKPSIRTTSNLSYPVKPSVWLDKSIDTEAMSELFKKVFSELGINPKEHWVMVSSPANLSDKLKEQYMDILINQYNVLGVNIANQTLLAMYSYNTKSGIMVDIGDRLEIVPVTDGYVVEGGVTKQIYGGRRVGEAFNIALTERSYPFFSDIDYQLVRLAMEKMCFVSEDYEKSVEKWNVDHNYNRQTLELSKYEIPQGFVQEITIDLGRFQAPEGLFNTDVWGMDNPTLPKLIQKAVQACPLDTRREMWRSIFLSGGATTCPGFTERLQAELIKLVPGSIVVEVHASPQRYHSAYIGGCTLAGLPQFEQTCISASEWRKEGPKILRKWHMY